MPPIDIAAMSRNWKALLISPAKPIVSELSLILGQSLPGTAVFEMQSYPTRQILAEMGGPNGPNLCFLDLISDIDRGLAVAGELVAIQPSIKIVGLLSSKHPDIILRAMRQGTADFLVRPFDASQLEYAIERIASVYATQNGGGAKQGRIIATMPSKGSCGASTIACNLAQHYKRSGVKRILLADLDPLTGTLSFLLKLRSGYSFLDVLSHASGLDPDVWKGVVSTSGTMDILLSPDTVQDQLHDLRNPSMLVDYARQNYDVAVLDAASVYGEWNLNLARGCDDLVLVTTNELPSLQAAQRSLSFLEANGISRSKVRLVVNRYNKELGLSREVIETALHSEVHHLLPSDYDSIQSALIEGKPVPSGTTFGKSIAQLADRLAPPAKPAPTTKSKTSALSGLFSIFSRG